ncbi:MAG: hypothetical protein QXM52_00790 [Candidatus Bathyarchaeia archaeon]
MEESATKKKQEITEKQSYKCANPSCQRIFANPIKVENISLKNKIYEACPYCLTEIKIEKGISVFEKQKPMDEKETEMVVEEEKTVQSTAEKEECKHYFGYLSERTTKEGLPEECLLCGKIVQCMLKNVAR